MLFRFSGYPVQEAIIFLFPYIIGSIAKHDAFLAVGLCSYRLHHWQSKSVRNQSSNDSHNPDVADFNSSMRS